MTANINQSLSHIMTKTADPSPKSTKSHFTKLKSSTSSLKQRFQKFKDVLDIYNAKVQFISNSADNIVIEED